MTTTAVPKPERARAVGKRVAPRILAALTRRPALREILIILAFCLFTAILTWPYATRLRDAVVDPGDPYLVAWILWWDYHATFTDPLNLFHANIFYPLRYTLAFSEHCYGLALPFFPLFALGLHPLTVHAVAMFFGFALCGYGAFRLARTLTGSAGAAWVAGIVFAFVPFRFHLMSHLPYLFTVWVPLLFEALVLFVRGRTRKRAAWLGFTFFMTGLTTVSWFTLSLFPFALIAALLLTRYELWREREFWRRGGIALGVASLALLPFMLPYYIASKLYGFRRSIEEVKANSAWPIHWLSVENRNKLWFRMGEGITDGWRFKLFPGLLPILFSLAALLLQEPLESRASWADAKQSRRKWLAWLDAFIFFLIALSILTVGFDDTNAFGGFFNWVRTERALAALTIAIIARLCFSYPSFLRVEHANLVETIRSERRGDAFWVGIVLFVVGFCYSLGWNFFFYRILYDVLPLFKSMRVPTRGAMIAYLGIALLAGLGARRIANLLHESRPRVRCMWVYAALCALLLFELNGAPLGFMRGAVYPDAVTLRLKETRMRGGIVVLPAGGDFNHQYILRAADHARPLIVGTSGFNSPYETKIEEWTGAGTIHVGLFDLFEQIPASYVVIKNELIPPERRPDYEAFLMRAITSGRLRFINRFDGRDDLYAVVKTEPDARSEAALPFNTSVREWATLIENDPVNLVGTYRDWSRKIYHIHVVATGELPRYDEFIRDAESVGRGVFVGFEEQDRQFQDNANKFAEALTLRAEFKQRYDALDDAQYVERLIANAGLSLSDAERMSLVEDLKERRETRAGLLLKIADDPRFVALEHERSLVLLHFFAYLRRNPDDPPDGNMNGFNYWVAEVKKHGGDDLAKAFSASVERKAFSERDAGKEP
jgi:hypothetical protein